MSGILERTGAAAERLVRRFMPDSFVLVLVPTMVSRDAAPALSRAGWPARASLEGPGDFTLACPI